MISFFLLVTGIVGYLLANSKASADQEEDVKELETNGVGSNVYLDILSKKLAENLPSPIEDYVDFQGQKELLDQRLKIQDIVIISGAGGMGKSALAAQYGNDCKQGGNAQVIWIKGTQIEEEFFRLARIMGIETSNLSSEIIRNLVYGNLEKISHAKRILLIFDNVETKEKIKRSLINLPNTSKVIITARNGDVLEGIQPININGFDKKEAFFYLRKTLQRNEEETEKIINAVGASPFRLSIVVAYLKSRCLMSVDEFISIYLSIKEGRSQNKEIYPEVEMLFGNLKANSPKAWALLKYLAYLDAGGVSVKFITAIMGQTVDELEESVNKLRELSLMQIIEGKETILKITHRIVQDETKKALVIEDATQVPKLLEKMIHELDQILPNVNDNLEHWRKAAEWINHAETLTQEGKKVNLSFTEKANLLHKIGIYYYQVNLNYNQALYYWKELLSYQKSVHQGNHSDIANTLNNIGKAYESLFGEQNIEKGIIYMEQSLEMRQKLFLGSHPDIATSFNSVGVAYFHLGGEQNIRKGLKYFKKSLKMRQKLFHGDNADVAKSLNNLGSSYIALGGEQNIEEGITYMLQSLKMRKKLFKEKHHSDLAESFNSLGEAYQLLGGEGNTRKALIYLQEDLKIRQELFKTNHFDLAVSLHTIGLCYEKLGDIDKLLEYNKQTYGIYLAIFNENDKKTKEIKSAIELLQPNFFAKTRLSKNLPTCLGGNKVGPEYRQIITSRGEINDHQIILKQKLQKDILNKIVESVDKYGWTYDYFGSIGQVN